MTNVSMNLKKHLMALKEENNKLVNKRERGEKITVEEAQEYHQHYQYVRGKLWEERKKDLTTM